MNNYFKIGEFARLRNININSLLYYEKIGILKPAYTDPETRYRYYSTDQLPTLDMILMAISLGIPLKSLKKYVDKDGNFLSKKLMEDAKESADKKIQSITLQMESIEYSLKCMEENDRYEGKEGEYRRDFPPRKAIVTPVDFDALEKTMVFETEKIFRYAQDEGLYPILPGGITADLRGNSPKAWVYFEIAYAKEGDKNVAILPEGTYRCVQIREQTGIPNPSKLINNCFGMEKGFYVISNMYCGKYQEKTQPSEIELLS